MIHILLEPRRKSSYPKKGSGTIITLYTVFDRT